MSIKRKPFKVPVKDGDPIRCIQMIYPGNRKEIYAAVPDVESFLERQNTPVIQPTNTEDWETLHDSDIVGLQYYSLSVIPWLVPKTLSNALVRDRIVRLIRIATQKAANI